VSHVRLASALVLLSTVLGPSAASCKTHTDDGTTPHAFAPLPALSIRDDTPDLLLTWIDAKGDTHVETKPSDVPAEGRGLVRVVVANREEGTHDELWVVDLTKKGADGAYAATTMTRHAWEAEIEKRRAALLGRTAPPAASAAPTGSSPATTPTPREGTDKILVVIYGASWCKPCHEAAAYLKRRGVAYVMKDVEETPGAAAEMQDKLKKANQHGGSIPVIDVRGQILVGFNPAALDRALAKATAGTML
jgi:glutaredoxin